MKNYNSHYKFMPIVHLISPVANIHFLTKFLRFPPNFSPHFLFFMGSVDTGAGASLPRLGSDASHYKEGEYFAVHLFRDSRILLGAGYGVSFFYSLVDSQRNVIYKPPFNDEMKMLVHSGNDFINGNGWISSVMKVNELLERYNSICINGKIQIKTEIFFHELEFAIQLNQSNQMNELSLFDIMIQPTDVILKACDGFEIKANKQILSQHSEVFHAMFNLDMVESSSKIVEIIGFSHKIMHELVRFIYCKQVSDIDSINIELFKAAHTYNIKDLPEFCLMSIIKHLSLRNIIDVVTLADLYDQTILFAICCERITM